MHETLLRTKLHVPPLRPNLVPRPRLIEQLNQGLQLGQKLTLISAPAGYGTTTSLIQWVNSTRLRIAWLSLDRADNDFECFFRYLLMAWEEVQPGVLESPLGTLLGAISPDNEAVLAAFINLANELANHAGFILDDYHLIEEPAIHQALTFLLDHLPANFHFVLAGRGEPPLPLARYRARDELQEIGADDLRFRPEESELFLTSRMNIALAPEAIELIQTQLEGWVAGLQMVALGLKRGFTEAARSDRLAVTGRQRFIADYFRQEVLAHLSDDRRRFLLQTSILERLCGPLCEAVTGKAGGQAMLETLEREALFLVPLDDRREWFRYHRPFADMLQEELERRHPDEVAGLHQRAAGWYMARDLPEPAFDHAVEGDDVQMVHRIFERHAQTKMVGGEVRILKRWLDALPEPWISDYPLLDLFRASLLMITGQLQGAGRHVDAIEQRLLSADRDDAHIDLARVSAIRCAIACYQNNLLQAEIYANQAFQDLPVDDLTFRTFILGALGDTYRRNGRWAEAKERYLNLFEYAHAPAFRLYSAHAFGALADLDLRQGRLKSAAGYWKKALAIIQDRENWGLLPLPLIGWVYIRMGELLYEWNELVEARDYVSRGLERAELGGDARALITGYLIAGRLKLTEGDSEMAEEYLEQARPLVENTQFSELIGRVERFQLELWLAQDRLRTAVIWSDKMMQDDALERRPESEVAQLALARVLIVKGDGLSVNRGLALLESLLQAAEAEGRAGVTIEALALRALAHWKLGDQTAALTALERTLRLGEHEGYVRLFADLGLPMARLLQEARSRAVLPDYASRLLAAFGADLTIPRHKDAALPEPLTSREHEVLQLIAAGLTNPEIAAELVIAPETVKKHAGNIYSKLGVGSRTEAAARARALDLLD